MLLPQDQKVVQALPPQTSQKPLTNRVRFWRFVWCSQYIDARRYSIERCTILAVVVPDQESWLYTKWRGFPQLLCYPRVCWVSRDAKMDHTARAQLDNDEHEHRAEQNIVCLQEVAGPNLTGVVA